MSKYHFLYPKGLYQLHKPHGSLLVSNWESLPSKDICARFKQCFKVWRDVHPPSFHQRALFGYQDTTPFITYLLFTRGISCKKGRSLSKVQGSEADILCMMGEEALHKNKSFIQVCERIFCSDRYLGKLRVFPCAGVAVGWSCPTSRVCCSEKWSEDQSS